MARLKRTNHLTEAYDDALEKTLSWTHQGMAHFAGTGPDHTTCNSCAFYGTGLRKRTHSEKPADQSCMKYKALTGLKGKTFPRSVKACKYYERGGWE